MFLLGSLSVGLFAQEVNQIIKGQVAEASPDGSKEPLVGANVFWKGTLDGTTTDYDGQFELKQVEGNSELVVSYIGYQNDTILVADAEYVEILLNCAVVLDEVQIVHRKRSTEIAYTDPLKIEKIGEKELLKAACCNLSESFETSPSVDVSFTDAVTGTRQIQMLGLSGPYTQITRENMPSIRGLSSLYGLYFVPGTWIEGIQLNKGVGTVVNGFESIAGQINVELRKPEQSDKLYLNGYINEMSRMELNANFAHSFKGDKWHTGILLHGKNNSVEHDRNADGFLDNPVGKNIIVLNRWKYVGDNGLRTQFAIKGTLIDHRGGQLNFEQPPVGQNASEWGMDLDIKRLEAWAKIGMSFEEMPWKSWGLQLMGATHEQDSFFGRRDYNASQNSFYANWLYQSIFSNTNHKFLTGASLQYDDYREDLAGNNYDRVEVVPGAFFEYTYTYLEKFSLVAGIRGDYHNLFGAFLTPRLHLRYALSDNTILRTSAGRGQRTANILSENNGLLATSREFVIFGDDSDKPYGLDPEVAWNVGINLTQTFNLDYREGTFTVDFYRTHFENQIVTDLDNSPQTVLFYNLDGKSYSNAIQLPSGL